jgi:hypothetical protein
MEFSYIFNTNFPLQLHQSSTLLLKPFLRWHVAYLADTVQKNKPVGAKEKRQQEQPIYAPVWELKPTALAGLPAYFMAGTFAHTVTRSVKVDEAPLI